MQLFENQSILNQPLSTRMRPRSLEEYIGQSHILGEGRLLRRLIQADRLSSLIFYGPPGTGKTTLASVIANTTKSRFVILNAVLSGVKELRAALEEAEDAQKLYDKKTILFIDEVHRWNKAQQDALLPWVENGTIVLIGATTENPYFEVNPALVSRSRIFRLKKLSSEEMRAVLEQVLNDKVRGYGDLTIFIDEEAIDHLVKTADGDARNLLNALELAVETTSSSDGKIKGKGKIEITLSIAEESIQEKAVLYDKEGEYHYDVISAFIKSIRGSDPDAALYWLARMIAAGENPRFIFRRMLISACEDVGMADPHALEVVEAAACAFDRVGLPEGQFMLTHAVLYLSTCPKSNSSLAFFDALEMIQKEGFQEVPNPLKDGNRDSDAFSHGKGYLYPHAFKEHWVAQQYLPSALQGKIFYHPGKEGYEALIRDTVLRRRELQLESAFLQENLESYSWSFENPKLSAWLKRATQKGEEKLLLCNRLIEMTNIDRSALILVLEENSALLYWQLLRKAVEGGVYLLCDNETISEHIKHYFIANKIDDTPLIIHGNRKEWEKAESFFHKNPKIFFDFIMGRNLLGGLKNEEGFLSLLSCIKKRLHRKGELLFSQKDFPQSTLLSQIIESRFEASDKKPLQEEPFKENDLSLFVDRLKTVEAEMQETIPFCFPNKKIINLLEQEGFSLIDNVIFTYEKEIQIDPALINQWFLSEQMGYGQFIQNDEKEKWIDFLKKMLTNQTIVIKNCDYLYRVGLSK